MVYQVICLDLFSGKKLWEQTVHRGTPDNPIHLKNSFASETPVTDGERVYAYFGNLGLYCLDLQGNAVWSKRFEPRATRHGWGTAASPVLHGDRLYILNDNDEQSYLLCLDKRTGEEVWRVDRDEGSNWATPFIWQNELRTEIVTPGTDKVRSYDLKGNLLWWFTGMSVITIATPYTDNGLLYISSGYVRDRQRPLYAIRSGASGDISLKPEQTENEFIAWCQPTAGPYNPTTLLYEGRVYVLYDRSMLSCYRSLTGEPLFEQQRIRQGRHFTASPWAYDGKVFCLNEDGVTFVFRAGDQFELLHTNELADDDMCMATPAIVGDRLLIRTSTRVYCIRPSVPSSAP
jgi:outer membrane protein assembly factor BamB